MQPKSEYLRYHKIWRNAEIEEIYKETMVEFLYSNSHFLEAPLGHATLDYVYSIQFQLPGSFSRSKYLRLLDEINDHFNEQLESHNFFYLTIGDECFVIFMECSEEIDDVLLKLATSSQVLNQHTKEEYNKSVDEINLTRNTKYNP